MKAEVVWMMMIDKEMLKEPAWMMIVVLLVLMMIMIELAALWNVSSSTCSPCTDSRSSGR